MSNEINYIELLNKRAYIPGHIPNKENILFKIQGENIGATGSLVIFSGLPKSGKSTFLTACLASAISRQPVFTLELIPDKLRPKIAIFDTESSESDFYKHIDRIKSISGINELPENIKPYNTRPDDPAMQIKLISEYLENNTDTSILFIDTLLDLCNNFNDEVESKKLMSWIKKISFEKNIIIISVLHTGKDGLQRLGHLGANADRAAQSVLQVRKDEGNFILESKFLRSSGGFLPIEVKYNKDSNAYILENKGIAESKLHWKYYSRDKHFEKLEMIFTDQKLLSYDQFIKEISRIESRGVNYCKEYFKYFKDKEMITQNINGFWLDSRILF